MPEGADVIAGNDPPLWPAHAAKAQSAAIERRRNEYFNR